MPYVNIKLLDENVSREQKSEVIARVTQALVEVLGKRPEACNIVIDEVGLDNWGIAGVTVNEYRKSPPRRSDAHE